MCKNSSDSFCYICGQFMMSSMRKTMSSKLKVAYHLYFGCQVGDQNKSWAPHYCCTQCYTSLTQWLNGKRKSMPFAVPMVWREQKNHTDDCYFCSTQVSGHSMKTRKKSSIQIVRQQYGQCFMEMDCLYPLHLQIHQTLMPLRVMIASLRRPMFMSLILPVNHHLTLTSSVRLI